MKMDLTNAPTVEEYVNDKGCKRLWLCPSLVSNGKIGNPPYLSGLECSASTIPDQVKGKKVRRHFNENGVECIIWENDNDISFIRKK